MSDEGEEWKGEPEPSSMYGFGSMGMFTIRPETPEQKAAREKQAAIRRAAAELRAMTLTTFRADAHCAKCGGLTVRVRYCASGQIGLGCFDDTAGKEHLHRTCKTCRYVWYELPLDSREDHP